MFGTRDKGGNKIMEEGLKWNLGGKLKVGENTLRLHLGN